MQHLKNPSTPKSGWVEWFKRLRGSGSCFRVGHTYHTLRNTGAGCTSGLADEIILTGMENNAPA